MRPPGQRRRGQPTQHQACETCGHDWQITLPGRQRRPQHARCGQAQEWQQINRHRGAQQIAVCQSDLDLVADTKRRRQLTDEGIQRGGSCLSRVAYQRLGTTTTSNARPRAMALYHHTNRVQRENSTRGRNQTQRRPVTMVEDKSITSGRSSSPTPQCVWPSRWGSLRLRSPGAGDPRARPADGPRQPCRLGARPGPWRPSRACLR